jgi:ATP synthase protein I
VVGLNKKKGHMESGGETDPEEKKMARVASRFVAVGLEMGLALLIGVFGGKYLDEQFGTKPWFFIFGFIIGLGAATKAVIDAARTAKRVIDNGSSPTDED